MINSLNHWVQIHLHILELKNHLKKEEECFPTVLFLLSSPYYNKTLCSAEKSRKNDQSDGMGLHGKRKLERGCGKVLQNHCGARERSGGKVPPKKRKTSQNCAVK